uniref:Glycosyltransferase n=1 Tax=Polygala tenuifolia TaxID=355332 RepID=A0A3G3NC58_9FABA|nr:UDP-glucosyltransferase UGT73BA1 [Polygala tenuifolia]
MASSKPPQMHFFLVPFMCPGHIIPMADIAIVLAQHGVLVTLVTTPLNAIRIKPAIDSAVESKLLIRLVQLKLSEPTGLPEGCESVESIPSRSLIRHFLAVVSKLQQPMEQLFQQQKPVPNCILADKHIVWIKDIATKFQVPWLMFDGTGCFASVCNSNVLQSKVHETVPLPFQPFVVPNMPHHIEFTREQLPGNLNPICQDIEDLHESVAAAEEEAYGVVVNSFEDLELEYVKEYQKTKGGRVWCIGPVSLSNKALAHRGNKAVVDENECIRWLNSWPQKSVVYVCLGSVSRLTLQQLTELAFGLEESECPFVWAMREDKTGEVGKWMSEDGFKERTKGRGFIICGWAPQLVILSHPSIGVFLTHCGWNSTMEGICAGVPMITWPMFSDQFYNEKLIVQILNIGESVGSKVAVPMGMQDRFGVLVRRKSIQNAIVKVLLENGAEDRKVRAERLAIKANKSKEEGGSSCLNIKNLIQHITELSLGQYQT